MKTTEKDTKQRTENFWFDLQTAIDIGLNEMILPDADKILYKYIEYYYDGGEVTPIKIHENAETAANIINFCEHNKGGKHDGNVREHEGERTLIAEGILSEDIDWEDNDPYQTAGGYKKGVVRAGTPANVYIRYEYHGFYIEVEARVSIVKDYYNSNFCGNSLNSPADTYEEGERTESHKVEVSGSMHVLSRVMDDYVVDYQKVIDFVRSAGQDRHRPEGKVR